jgi:hypothetical protein
MTDHQSLDQVAGAGNRSDEELADFTGGRMLRPHVWRSAIPLTVAFLFLIPWMIGLTSAVLGSLSAVGMQAVTLPQDLSAAMSLFGLGGFAVFLITWVASLFAPARESVAESNLLLEDGADRASEVFGAIRAYVESRCPPFTCDTETIREQPSLYVSNGTEWAVLIVQPIGPDLHVSWTMWRNRSTIALVGRALSDMFEGSASDSPLLLRAGSCGALRQMLHAATRRASTSVAG